ncbi:hypothetical protein V6N13_057822 [Hibiscus sabdariffa]
MAMCHVDNWEQNYNGFDEKLHQKNLLQSHFSKDCKLQLTSACLVLEHHLPRPALVPRALLAPARPVLKRQDLASAYGVGA